MFGDFGKKPIPFWLIAGIIAVVLMAFLVTKSGQESGKQVYEISTDSFRRFKIIEIEIDPFEVKKGKSQQVIVSVEDLDDKPITSENKVEGIAITDNKATPFSLELKKISDANGSGTLTIWEGSWVLENTCDKIYIISVTAQSAEQEHKVDLTLR